MKLHLHDTDFDDATDFLMLRPAVLVTIKTEGKPVRISWEPVGEPKDRLSLFPVTPIDDGYLFQKPKPALVLMPQEEARMIRLVGNGSHWNVSFREVEPA